MGKERMDKAPVRADSVKLHIGTYPPGEPSDLPMFFEKKPYQGATGKVYPIPFATPSATKSKTWNTTPLSWRMNIWR